MALKSISASETFFVDDVVVFSSYGEQYGVKLLKSVYVAETDTVHFIAAEVTIKDNKPVFNKSGDALNLTAHTTAGLRKYSSKWTPDVDSFKSGDVLEDQDGVLYLFLSNLRVWNLSKGTQTSLDRWQSSVASYGGRKFKAKKTAGGAKFSKFVKAEDLM
jgi:hypothetical protein